MYIFIKVCSCSLTIGTFPIALPMTWATGLAVMGEHSRLGGYEIESWYHIERVIIQIELFQATGNKLTPNVSTLILAGGTNLES